MADDPETVVRRYFAIVADLGSSSEDLLAVLDPDVRVIEHPNMIAPNGAVRDRDGVIAGFQAGKRLLAEQAIEVHEAVAAGDRVAVRATWRGTIAAGSPALPAGTRLEARIAAFLTVAGGRIAEHETYDCYPAPVPPG